MKKLMIGLVGALAMVASAEVESSTVGYTTSPLEGFQFVGSSFLRCGTIDGDFKFNASLV